MICIIRIKKNVEKTDEPEVARYEQWYIDNVYSRRHTAIVVARESVQLEKGGNYTVNKNILDGIDNA